jgi:AcrR family transcriptional regulator
MYKKSMKKNTRKKINVLFSFSKSEMLKNGVSKYNLEKVIANSKISKSTFYKYFSNKKNFLVLTVDWILEDLIDPFKEYLKNFKTLEDLLNLLSNLNFDLKSILNAFPLEDIFSDTEIRKHLNQYYYKTFGKMIIEKIKELQEKDEIRNDIPAEFVFEFITSLTKGMGKLLIEYDYNEVVRNYYKLIHSAIRKKDK